MTVEESHWDRERGVNDKAESQEWRREGDRKDEEEGADDIWEGVVRRDREKEWKRERLQVWSSLEDVDDRQSATYQRNPDGK